MSGESYCLPSRKIEKRTAKNIWGQKKNFIMTVLYLTDIREVKR